MTFCPEWLTGSPSLDTSNVLNFWIYLVVRVVHTLSLSFHPLKRFLALVHEHHLGFRSPVVDVGFLPRDCRVIAFNRQSQIGLKM